MKTAEPKIIYLQIGDDADITEFNESDFQTNAISWCWERIFPNDIEYVSKSQMLALVDGMKGKIDAFDSPTDMWDKGYDNGYNKALTELKQKIEAL